MEREKLVAVLRRAAMTDDLPKVGSDVLFQAADTMESDRRRIAALTEEVGRLWVKVLAFEDAVESGELTRGPKGRGGR